MIKETVKQTLQELFPTPEVIEEPEVHADEDEAADTKKKKKKG